MNAPAFVPAYAITAAGREIIFARSGATTRREAAKSAPWHAISRARALPAGRAGRPRTLAHAGESPNVLRILRAFSRPENVVTAGGRHHGNESQCPARRAGSRRRGERGKTRLTARTWTRSCNREHRGKV
jgi:hypothetical protein